MGETRRAPGAATGRRATRASAPALTTLREGSLHAALKSLYAGAAGRTEALVDGFVVDVKRADAIVEVQTASLASIRRKLSCLLVEHRVVLVHPVALERWLVRVGEGGELLGRRRSPKRGLPLDAFDELVGIAPLLAHPNLALDLVLIREEEIRGPIPPGARYRYPRQWWRLDRRLVEVIDTMRFESGQGLWQLLPPGLPGPFTTADIVLATRRSPRVAMRTVYTLEKAGEVRRVGRRGQHVAYELATAEDRRCGAAPGAPPGPVGDVR